MTHVSDVSEFLEIWENRFTRSRSIIRYIMIQNRLTDKKPEIIFFATLVVFSGWSKGLKAPEGSFRSFGPAGVLRRRLLHRNGTFVPPAQWTRTRQGWKRILGEKQAVARKRKELPDIGGCQNDRNFGAIADVDSVFFRWWPKTGCFGRFSGSRGSKWDVHFLMLTQKERCAGWSERTKLILFQYD